MKTAAISPAVNAIRTLLAYQIAVEALYVNPSPAATRRADRAKARWIAAGSPTCNLPPAAV